MRPGYNLAPSASILLTLNAESSNFGGYNGAYGTTQNGALLSILGAFGNCPVAPAREATPGPFRFFSTHPISRADNSGKSGAELPTLPPCSFLEST